MDKGHLYIGLEKIRHQYLSHIFDNNEEQTQENMVIISETSNIDEVFIKRGTHKTL